MSSLFISRQPQLEDYWRGIVLFGRNVASYKFALAKALLDLKPQSGELLRLEDLAPVYSGYISEHLRHADKQGTSATSRFLEACRKFNSGELNQDELVEHTIRYGFNNVIDAFHVVGNGEIPNPFYVDERKVHHGIRITDEFSELMGHSQAASLPEEVEGRWRLVETAWALNIPKNVVPIGYEKESESLYSLDRRRKRKTVTGSRGALNGYQEGKCFYCSTDITTHNKMIETYPDVDHFFPHVLKDHGFGDIVDGIWNLVPSCRDCNRGERGKFASVPTIRLLERLHKRNEFLISSHHPLRETLMLQTGVSENERKGFLNDFYSKAWSVLIHTWEPPE